jgi:hypothetical protein
MDKKTQELVSSMVRGLKEILETEVKGIRDWFDGEYTVEQGYIFEAGYLRACDVMERKLDEIDGKKCVNHFWVDSCEPLDKFKGKRCLFCEKIIKLK